ncbi:MAG: IMP dehydrogenase, partial [Spirochaetia bacterium]
MKIEETLSYDDVLLEPSYSEVLPGDARIHTRLTRTIHLNIPLISAAMDTVTEAGMAIALALEGGSGVIHRNMDPVVQAAQVAQVKRFLNWVIESPITVGENEPVANVRVLMLKNNVSGFPVVDDSGRLRGIITGRDLRFCSDDSRIVREIMTESPIVETGLPTPESAREKFDRHKIEKLPVVDEAGLLTGLITVKDMEKHQKFPRAAVDDRGRLRVGAAVSPIDFEMRLPLLLE